MLAQKILDTGELTLSKNRILSDTYKDISRIKGYFKGKTKVKPYLRKAINRLPDRDLGQGLSFLFKPNPPEEAIKVYRNLKQVSKTAPVSSIFESDIKVLTQTIKSDLSKPIVIKTIIPQTKIPLDLKPFLAPVTLREKQAGWDENRFSGTAPSGRTGNLTGTGKFGDLGIFEGRFKTSFESEQETRNRAIEKVKRLIEEQEQNRNRERTLGGFNLFSKGEFRERIRETERTREGLKTGLIQKERQKQASLNLSKFVQTTKQAQREIEKQTPRTKIPPFKFDLTPLESGASKVKKKFEEGGFDLYLGIGKSKKVASNLPKEEANYLGRLLAMKTLKASFGIKPSGRQAVSRGYPKSKDVFGKMFEPSKSKKGFFVEKRKYRLDNPLEVSTIQKSKKKKSKRKEKLNWW